MSVWSSARRGLSGTGNEGDPNTPSPSETFYAPIVATRLSQLVLAVITAFVLGVAVFNRAPAPPRASARRSVHGVTTAENRVLVGTLKVP